MIDQYQIKSDDMLTSIAKRYGVTIEDIIKANPQIKDRDIIYIGDWIAIPVITSKVKSF